MNIFLITIRASLYYSFGFLTIFLPVLTYKIINIYFFNIYFSSFFLEEIILISVTHWLFLFFLYPIIKLFYTPAFYNDIASGMNYLADLNIFDVGILGYSSTFSLVVFRGLKESLFFFSFQLFLAIILAFLGIRFNLFEMLRLVWIYTSFSLITLIFAFSIFFLSDIFTSIA